MKPSTATMVRMGALALMALVSGNTFDAPRVYACTTCEWSCSGGSCYSSRCLSGGAYYSCTTNGSGYCSVSGEGCH
jgi:hypothetical protein